MKSSEKRYGIKIKVAACLLALLMLVSLMPFSALAENDMIVYFAAPNTGTGWSDYDEIRFNLQYGGGSSEWYTPSMTDTGFIYNGLKVYSVELDSSAVFKRGGYHKLQFQAYKNGAWRAQVVYNSSASWRTDQATWNGKIFYNGSWVEYTPPTDVTPAKRVYFDATYSKRGIKNYDLGKSVSWYESQDQSETNKCIIPNPNIGKIYYYAHGAYGNVSGELTRDGTSDLYYVDLAEGYSENIVFSASEITALSGNHMRGGSTAVLTIPDGDNLCFFADANDYIVYDENFNGSYRGGYWGNKGDIRNPESGKSTDIVDIASGTFTRDSDTYYIKTTLYDYYTDYELSGYNLDTRASHDNNAFRKWYSFRLFDTALSEKYDSLGSSSVVPIYTGQFQPNYSNWGYLYSSIMDVFPLYGTTDLSKFMSVNNSTLNGYGNGEYYACAALGLVYDKLNGGEVKVKGASGTVLPYFDPAFLGGNNSLKAVIGETYSNVSFPFTRKEVDHVNYWHFDSAETTLTLKRDGANYFLAPVTSSSERAKYRNLNSNGTHDGEAVATEYGFFPFNSGSTDNKGDTYNFGFGAKMELNFHLTENGKIKGSDGVEHPIIFSFSGDDDLWVFIDDQLVLDVGGDHAIVTGTINFADKTTTVSGVKASWGNMNPSATSTFTLTGKNTDQHKMVIYYMERGMWSSNFKVDFNIPDDNQLVIEESLNVDNINDELFPKTIQTLKSTAFNFGISNLVTHYGTVSTHPEENGQTIYQRMIMDYGSAVSGKLEPIEGAQYQLLSDRTSSGGSGSGEGLSTYDPDDKLSMKDGQYAVFENEFRRGSYISIEQTASNYGDLFKTKWSVYDYDGEVVTAFGAGDSVTNGSVTALNKVQSTKTNDGRTEKIFQEADESSLATKYQQTSPATRPDNSFVFRSYKNPDGTSRDTSLKVLYENEVKVGSLTISKAQADGSSALSGTYTFTVTFTDVGGHDLEEERVTRTITLGIGDSYTFTGIPAGTQYTVTETGASDGARLTSVDGDTSKTSASGTIADGVTSSHVFANYNELITLQITKNWYIPYTGEVISDGSGTGTIPPELVSDPDDMPAGAKARFQVQRRVTGSTEWENVEIVTVTVNTSDGSVSSDTETKTYDRYVGDAEYEYRVFEIDDKGNAVEESGVFVTEFAKVQYLSSSDDGSTATFYTLQFNNLLLPLDPEIRVKKLWYDGDGAAITADLPDSVTLILQRRSVTFNEGDPIEGAWTDRETITLLKADYGGKTLGRYPLDFEDGYYEYRVVETSGGSAVEDGGAIAIGEDTFRVTYSDEVNFDDNYTEYTVTNTLIEEGSITISKTVSGSMGNKAYAYEFTLKLTGYKLNPVPEGLTDKSGEGADGIYIFTLTHGDSITITLPIGTAYEITETVLTGYSVTINGEASAGGKKTGTVANNTPITVAYTNTREGTVPTGVDLASGAPLLMSAAAGLAALIAIRKKKED